jgi:sensor c-di-GMP phosphodiesterase-like protein
LVFEWGLGFLQTRRQKVVAVLAGVLVAGAGLFAFNYGLKQFVARQGYEELQALAERKLTVAEDRLNRLLEIVNDLHERGIGTCQASHMQMLRQTALSVSVIKEIALVGADGQTDCTTLGSLDAQRKVISSHSVVDNPQVVIEVIATGNAGDNMLRVRRLSSDNAPGLALMLLGSRIFSHRSEKMNSGDSDGLTRAEMQDGTFIGQHGALRAAGEGGFSMSLTSENFGIEVTTTISKLKYRDNAARLQMFGSAIFGGLIMILLAIASFVPSRQRENPIAELERALEAGEFVPYYQPIVDLVTGKLRGAEVLVRWRKPDGSTVPPALFIPLAESSGLILEMTRVLMRKVCQEIGPAFAQRQHLKICFNLAAQHFQDDSIVRDVRAIFGQSQVRLSQVVLELTERQPIENLAETRRLIATLQALGVRMALDDVGTGHSGLSYILKLGVDIIKIDKMFVDAIGIDRSSTTIIETLVDLAHNMRMDIVAEGVETFEQVVCLRDRGIRAAQGFVFAPPLPGTSFLQLVEAADPVHAAISEKGILAVV